MPTELTEKQKETMQKMLKLLHGYTYREAQEILFNIGTIGLNDTRINAFSVDEQAAEPVRQSE